MNHVSEKLVSVIIPVYNIAEYITQTIESILCQTYQHLEIIIINDGSSDNTCEILERYASKDSRIIILHQTNQGISAARNHGFKMAKGEYVCILDGDDVMMPQKIELQIKHLNDHPEADFTYSKVFYFDDKMNTLYIRDLITPDGTHTIYKKLLRHGNFISPNSVLFKKEVYSKYGGFDEGLRSSEDFEYWLRLSQQGVHFIHQNNRLTLCRIRKNSLTADSVMMYTTVTQVFEKHILNGRSKLTAALVHPQYAKNLFLYYFSLLKRSKSSTSQISRHENKPNIFAVLFALIRKLKWSLTFKEVYDKEVKEYLERIGSYKPL